MIAEPVIILGLSFAAWFLDQMVAHFTMRTKEI